MVTDDWIFWLNENTGDIGYSVFDTPDKTRYYRVGRIRELKVVEEGEERDSEEPVCPPCEILSETLYLDSNGNKTEIVKHSDVVRSPRK